MKSKKQHTDRTGKKQHTDRTGKKQHTDRTEKKQHTDRTEKKQHTDRSGKKSNRKSVERGKIDTPNTNTGPLTFMASYMHFNQK